MTRLRALSDRISGNKKPAELVACGGLGGSESRTGARSYVIATPSEPITVGMSAAIADETMTAATAALAGVAVSIDVSFALIIDPYPNDGIDFHLSNFDGGR